MTSLKHIHVYVDHNDSAATSDHSAATSDHSAATSDHSAGSTVCGSNKRTVTWEIIKGFISQYDKKFHTLQWLDFQCEVMESTWLG